MHEITIKIDNLREVLRRRNISQAKFARLVECSASYLSEMLKGKYTPSPEMRDKIITILNSTDYISHPQITWDDIFYSGDAGQEKKMSKKIIIFDTTLRDGEQSPGASMNIEEKVEVARQLARLGVDVIEAGFPISSDRDFEAVNLIAREIKGPIIAGLCRANEKDIRRAYEAVSPAENKRIHTFIATSDIHMEHKLRKSRPEVLKMAVDAVSLAKSLCDDVEFSAEDATRSNIDFLCEIIEAVIDAGATTINVPDTVGYAIPEEFGKLIATIKSRVKNIDKAIISVHCHNDLGLAVANSLAAIQNGAGQVECTINGLGERAGNASIEEVTMALQTRFDLFGTTTNINSKEIMRSSRLISDITGIQVQPNKAIVGANAFAHESGIHQHGMLAHRQTYEIMNPEDVGAGETKIVIGIHSGKHAVLRKLMEMGYELDDAQLEKVVQRVKQIAEKKKEVTERDLEAIVTDEATMVDEQYKLDYLQVICGTSTIPTTVIRILHNNEEITKVAIGVGSVDSLYKAIDEATSLPHKLVDYIVHSISGGTDAIGEVTVRISDENGKIFNGRGSSTDIIESSAKAYIQALNRLATQNANINPQYDIL